MTLERLGKILGYAVSLVMAGAGLLVLSGALFPVTTPRALRYTFGTVLVLFAVYRFILTRMRRPPSRENRW